MPVTLLLTVIAMAISLAIAVPVGILNAVRRNSLFDHGATFVVFLGTSMPVFWTGIMLILLFAVQLRMLPVSGWDTWSALLLPAVTLATFSTPLFPQTCVAPSILSTKAISLMLLLYGPLHFCRNRRRRESMCS